MILPLHARLRTAIVRAVVHAHGLDATDLPAIVVECPPNRALGDLAVPLAFELARRLRKPPRVIAQEIAGALEPIEGIQRVEAAANGYVNFYLDRGSFLRLGLATAPAAGTTTPTPAKTIVEHTAINPNKAAHIGHLRNAALGDTLVRLLRYQGNRVEVQNYIDDTGVQVADVVLGFLELETRDLAGVQRVADTTRFDYYCWDLYARVTDWYEQQPDRLQQRASTLHELERGDNAVAAMARFIADRVVRCHLQTMARINVTYDLVAWEGDILRLEFWAQAFDLLKRSGAIFKQARGPLAGCWVMRIDETDGDRETADGRDEATPPAEAGGDASDEAREKVIVRSDGTVTYVGKDIAYQFWKLGLLGKDFHYRPLDAPPGGPRLWSTSADPPAAPTGDAPAAPRFGMASRTYNVIDTRQAYLQKLLQQALVSMGHVEQARRSIHFSYEMVALSHATARELGVASADPARPFVEVSGRKGVGVKADDLLDRLLEKARLEVETRNTDLSSEECRRIAEMIATAAVRYFMIKFSRGRIIAFDIDEALAFEGESGPYLQYAVVRANNIFQKLRQREGQEEADMVGPLAELPPSALTAGAEGDEIWSLVLEAARLDEVVDQAVRTLELSVLAKYAFGVAQRFNGFYHRFPILNEPRPEIRLWRAATVSYCKAQLTRAVTLMGFEVPPRM